MVLDHRHEPAVVLENLGTQGQQLVIQTGTVIFDFSGSPDGGWVRDRLIHPVLDLPPGTGAQQSRVQAIASAAPASMSYSPPPAAGGDSGLWARGTAFLQGHASEGYVQVIGEIALPVTGTSRTVPISGAGWAVDQTRAVRSNFQIQLVVDLAVAGPSKLMRLAYSLFVAISPKTTLEP
jgi:hypothetical protein